MAVAPYLENGGFMTATCGYYSARISAQNLSHFQLAVQQYFPERYAKLPGQAGSFLWVMFAGQMWIADSV